MKCPKCKGETRVIDTRHDNETMRCRVCKECGHRFYTLESERNIFSDKVFGYRWRINTRWSKNRTKEIKNEQV